jgi:dihydrofolate reductase
MYLDLVGQRSAKDKRHGAREEKTNAAPILARCALAARWISPEHPVCSSMPRLESRPGGRVGVGDVQALRASNGQRRCVLSRLRVHAFSVSIDGFGAGPKQDLEHPLGLGGPELFDWFIPTRTWQRMQGAGQGETGVDDDLSAQGFENIGAWILGRNMFGPVRGPWPDDAWRGWWGEEPPYHVPAFVLTHHAREPLAMKGGTEFRFVTEGIEAALAQAKEAAGEKDVRLGGGVATIRQYLRARLIDELHLAISPVVLGQGEHLFGGLDLRALGYACTKHVPGGRAAAHVVLQKQG